MRYTSNIIYLDNKQTNSTYPPLIPCFFFFPKLFYRNQTETETYSNILGSRELPLDWIAWICLCGVNFNSTDLLNLLNLFKLLKKYSFRNPIFFHKLFWLFQLSPECSSTCWTKLFKLTFSMFNQMHIIEHWRLRQLLTLQINRWGQQIL